MRIANIRLTNETDRSGKVIAIIHRLNDVEDKWVAVPEDKTMTAEEIMEQVRFQEQYFETEIEML